MSETEKERTDRQLIELLTELRVALPGAQVLLGFLLTAPFATRFGKTSSFERHVFFACVLVTAVGALLLMGPSVYHRVRWAEGGKSDVVRVGHALFLMGTGCLGLGMMLAVFVVADVLFGVVSAAVSIALIAPTVVLTWYVLPLSRERRARHEE